MNEYRVGDWVRCIDNEYATDILAVRGAYQIDDVSPATGNLKLAGRDGWWKSSRFEPVAAGTIITNTPRAVETPEQAAARYGRSTEDIYHGLIPEQKKLYATAIEDHLMLGTSLPPPPQTILGTQVGGDHYTRFKIQPIEYIWANELGFSEGNVVKYVTRWKYKGGIKDLKKAHHNLALLIEEAERIERETGVKFGL